MHATNLVDVLALPVSETALHALQELGRGPVSSDFAHALERALCGEDVSVPLEDLASSIRLLAGLAIELSDAGPVWVVVGTAEAEPLRDALVRVARHAGRRVADDGDIRILDAADTERALDGGAALLGIDGDHAAAWSARAHKASVHPVVWTHPADTTSASADTVTLVAVPETTAMADAACRLVMARGTDSGVLIVVPDQDTMNAVLDGLDAAEVDAVVLDATVSSSRRHALATRVRRGEVEALVATEAALRDLDGRGFAGVLFVAPSPQVDWVRRGTRARQVSMLVADAALEAWIEVAVRSGRKVIVDTLIDAPAAQALRLTRARRALASSLGPAQAWHEERVRALVDQPGGFGVLASALRVFLRSERERSVAVATLSELHGPVGDTPKPRTHVRADLPKPVVAAEPAAAQVATEGTRKKRRRRRKRAPVGDGGTDATRSEGDDDTEDSGDDVDGPVEIDMADLDAVLEVE